MTTKNPNFNDVEAHTQQIYVGKKNTEVHTEPKFFALLVQKFVLNLVRCPDLSRYPDNKPETLKEKECMKW